jgi:hypothetical protein
MSVCDIDPPPHRRGPALPELEPSNSPMLQNRYKGGVRVDELARNNDRIEDRLGGGNPMYHSAAPKPDGVGVG